MNEEFKKQMEIGVDFYEQLCLDLDDSKLPASVCASSLIAALWYVFPELEEVNGHSIESLTDHIKKLFYKWKKKHED